MTRMAVSLATATYALGFVLVELAAVRWPSIIALGALFEGETSQFDRLQMLLNWRELGIVTAAPYFFAAFCFYSSTVLLQRHKGGAAVWYLLGGMSGFAPLILFDFEPNWWQNPDFFQQCVVLAVVVTVLLFGLVCELSGPRKPIRQKGKAAPAPNMSSAEPLVLNKLIQPVVVPEAKPEEKSVMKKKHRTRVSPAIARQRASFAMHGRRALRRQMR